MDQQIQAKGSRRPLWTAAAIILLVLVAPWRVMDRDALARLAVGRHIVQTGAVPANDPFTFSRPEARWVNPEWGGDLLWYGAHELGGGEPGMVALGLGLAALGIFLTMAWAVRAGASPPVMAGMLMVTLPALAGLLHTRNYVHAYWLIPLYLLILHRGGRWLWALAPLAVLWANLHSSFVVGWVLVAAALIGRLAGGAEGAEGEERTLLRARLRQPQTLFLLAVLVAHPLLAMAGPHGAAVYGQLWDHLANADIYRQWVLEWRPPTETRGMLAQLPLHLLGIAGLLSFLPSCNRRRLGGLVRVLACLALAYSSSRFLGLLAVLAAPDVAINLQRWLGSLRPGHMLARLAPLALLLAGLGLAGAAAHEVRTSKRPPLLEQPAAPLAAATFLARRAPQNTRLFNTYNAGPYLLWLSPRTRLYIDPRNNLGAPLVKRYVEQLLVSPEQFEAEAKKTGVQLALVDLTDDRYSVLATHLHRSRAWKLVHMDGCFAIHRSADRAASRRFAREDYLVLEGTLELEYLLQHHVVAIRHDLVRLKKTAPYFAAALEGYLLLSATSGPPPLIVPPSSKLRLELERGRELLSKALPHLPPSPALMSYLATADARLGKLDACKDVLLVASRLFPTSAHVLGLKVELARLGGDKAKIRALAQRMRKLGYAGHPVWQILASSGR